MLKLLSTGVAALGLAGFMLGGAVVPAAAAATQVPTQATITLVSHHHHHHRRWHPRSRHRVKDCRVVWRHHHRVRICTWKWEWRPGRWGNWY